MTAVSGYLFNFISFFVVLHFLFFVLLLV
jgi:hypothetical protein